MIKKLYALIVGFIVVFGMIITPDAVYADENKIPIDIKPVLPDNQDVDVTSYISINTKEDKLKQDLEFVITNNTSEKQEISVKVVDAYTSPSGVVQYTDKEQENSEISDDKYEISEYLKVDGDSVITLKGNEEKKVKTSLDVEGLDGILLGGIEFQTVETGEEIEQGETSFQIDNEINMVVGVKIDFGTEKEVELLNDKPYIDPMPSYYVVRLPITLDTPLFKKVDFDYEVLYKDDVLFKNENSYEFTPMSKTNISLAWEHDEIKKNKEYLLKGKLKYKDLEGNEQVREIEETFIYTGTESKKGLFETLKAPLETGNFNWYWLLLLIPLVGVYVYYQKRLRKDNEEDTSKEDKTD